MPPILRHAPGEHVPIAGTYALVGHFGEVMGFSVERDKGDRLPLVTASNESGPMWFVLVDAASADTKAA